MLRLGLSILRASGVLSRRKQPKQDGGGVCRRLRKENGPQTSLLGIQLSLLSIPFLRASALASSSAVFEKKKYIVH